MNVGISFFCVLFCLTALPYPFPLLLPSLPSPFPTSHPQLRMVWLTAQQKVFRQAVHDEDVELDIETCLCSLHLHGLLPYD